MKEILKIYKETDKEFILIKNEDFNIPESGKMINLTDWENWLFLSSGNIRVILSREKKKEKEKLYIWILRTLFREILRII